MNTTTVTRTEDSDLTCAECGTTTASAYVVAILDPANPDETRTEVCTDCHAALAAAPQTPAERPLTPYDTGQRAEPSPWVPTTRTDHARNLADHADDFGKVDFDDSESVTIATVWATPHADGWTLHVRETGQPVTLDAHTDQLDALAAEARTALADVEASTEADSFEDVIAARDAAAGVLQRVLDALRTDDA
jgi:hypothetical protein